MRLGNETALWLLWLLPVLALLWAYGQWRRGRTLRAFAEGGLLAKINTTVSMGRQWGKVLLLLVTVLLVVAALTEPAWSPHTVSRPRRGRDVVILLDVSRSMLARDNQPNRPSRLERAKLAINDLLDALEGDRVAIMAFAGTSTLACPLTHDYGFARLALVEIGPESVKRGGSLIGDAIRRATDEVFEHQEGTYQDLILISDGEDQESYPIPAAQEAAQKGVRILAIGLGDDTQGSRIPDAQGDDRFVEYKNEEVWSKLHAGTLEQIALASAGGEYFHVATGAIDLADIYRKRIAAASKRELDSATVLEYNEKFQIFLALALAGVLGEAVISDRKKH